MFGFGPSQEKYRVFKFRDQFVHQDDSIVQFLIFSNQLLKNITHHKIFHKSNQCKSTVESLSTQTRNVLDLAIKTAPT